MATAQTALPSIAAVTRRIARKFGAARLAYGHGTFNALDEAAWLTLHSCRIPLDQFEEHAERTLTAVELRRIEKLADRRIHERIPVAYLTHEAWLGEFSFYVDRRVIVPRSFIAELLPDGIAPFLGGPIRNALDMCTGSGCLAVLLAHAFPEAKVQGVDLSSGALAVARRNVKAYRLEKRIQLVHSNLFDAISERRYDLIVSNPPYVDGKTMARLPDEYLAEPRMALAGGKDGLELVHKILVAAKRQLTPHGTLVCEIGHNRKVLERAYPRVPFTWLDTSAGDGYVFLVGREQLPG
ncbi:MAG: 50S ribosomal protein L3 N(5)-glutamine methyltransferase [Betaproteobacteria bacterium]